MTTFLGWQGVASGKAAMLRGCGQSTSECDRTASGRESKPRHLFRACLGFRVKGYGC